MSKAQPRQADSPTDTQYILREYGGMLAVFLPQDTEPLAVYEVYVHLLPENDIEMLRRGIQLSSDYALQKALEDYGL